MTAPHGVLAVGDSLAQGLGLPLAGLTSAGWPARLAEALPGCLTMLAVNGARAADVARDQLPLLAGAERHQLGCLSVGANDLGSLRPAEFAASVEQVLRGLRSVTEAVLVATLPLTLGTAGQPWRETVAAIQQVNGLLRELAGQHQALVVEVAAGLTAGFRMAPDHQHPTALGYAEIAGEAARVLAAAGRPTARPPVDPGPLAPSAAERRALAVPRAERLRGLARELAGRLPGRPARSADAGGGGEGGGDGD